MSRFEVEAKRIVRLLGLKWTPIAGKFSANPEENGDSSRALASEGVRVVIAVQKELVMRHPHFFWGKYDVVDLGLLSPEELVEAYRLMVGDGGVFTEEALTELARLSRGVFRRFKNYVKITIEENSGKDTPWDAENVSRAITGKIIAEDMELELADVFEGEGQRAQALAILDKVRSGSMNQKKLAESLGMSEATVGRILGRLLQRGYIDRRREERGAWAVSRKYKPRSRNSEDFLYTLKF